MRALMVAFALLCTCSVAYAAPDTGGMADADFTAKYFGTTAVLHTARQVVDPDNWWGQLLPKEINDTPTYLIGIVNSRRMDNGETALLDPNEPTLIIANMEEQEENGWRYTIDFYDMRPSEVESLMELLGGPGKVLPGATTVSYEPVQKRYLYASYMGGDAPLVLRFNARSVEIPQSSDIGEIRSLIGSGFRKAFDREVPFEVILTVASYMDGTRSFDISVSADMTFVPGQGADGTLYID